MRLRSVLIPALLVLAAASAPARAGGNLLNDGSFENAPLGQTINGSIGDGPGGWTVSSTSTGAGALLGLTIAGTASTGQTYFGVTLPADPLNVGFPQAGGTHVAYFFGDTETDTLSQTITVTAGLTYQVGFDVTPTFTGGRNPGVATLSAAFGSTQLFSQTTGSLNTPTSAADASTWAHFGYNFTPTSSGSDTFTFTFAANEQPSQDLLIDRVYVSLAADASVPEPASLTMLASGAVSLAAFIAFRRLRGSDR
jgi:hypothetical protein